jgi:hypothetical protein
MALGNDLRALGDRALADLNAAHDYYADTLAAWKFVEDKVKAGATFTNQNPATGTVTPQGDLVARAVKYVAGPLAEATFQQFLAIIETFVLDLLRLWLLAYPQGLGAKQVLFKDILDAPDKDSVTLLVVNRELNDILYQRPKDWFANLEARVKLGCPTADEIDQIAEAKASRDVLIHNRGVANKIYLVKAGKLARFQDGDLLDIPEPYHREVWELLCKVVADVADAAVARAP